MRWLMKQWYSGGWLGYCLSPFSFLYQACMVLRGYGYQYGWKKTVRFSVPVIVVGNVTVGGTGKTPLVAWLAQWLQAQGLQPGLVSRGYGRNTRRLQSVSAESDPRQVGDEPVMLVQQTRCPMVVGADRVAAVRQLLREAACDVVISDDGLQHHALGRDIEIAVIDADRRWGNGFCLPAGPLRESRTRLKTVDFVIVHGSQQAEAEAEEQEYTMCYAFHEIRSVRYPEQRLEIASLRGKTVHAVAGIGHPERFFAQLEANQLSIIPHIFPDHHVYRAADLEWGSGAWILMTEKDAIKCRSFADDRHWYLPITVHVDPRFPPQLHQRLTAYWIAAPPTGARDDMLYSSPNK